MTYDELKSETRAFVSMREAANALGISYNHALLQAKANRFPIRVVRVGKLYKVPTLALKNLCGFQTAEGAQNKDCAAGTL